MRARIRLSSSALLKNIEILHRKSQGRKLIPMVKANAYGHDSVWVSKVLLENQKSRSLIHALGVATFSEAMELRKGLSARFSRFPILVFSDCAPWNNDWISSCTRFGFQPVFSDLPTFLEFQKWFLNRKGRTEVLFHIEVNTGMNRLGIPVDSLSLIQIKPESVFTHLAESESPESTLTRNQMSRFEAVLQWRNRRFPETKLHFANSGAIWNSRHYPLFTEMDWARPGLSLYGIRPFERAKDEGLAPVMTFEAPVIQKIFLEKGERVGYGGVYRSLKKNGEWVATLGSGYGDGIFRAMANQDLILGKVSMDLITIKATSKTQLGDWITLWGKGMDPYQVSKRAGTIPYEITTRIGSRVERIYE